MQDLNFEFNREKALEAIVFVLRQRPSMNLYNLLKIIFEADRVHLKKWGRPVTGDHYIAMDKGTVPSGIYDLLKAANSSDASLNYDSTTYIVSSSREPNLDFLSESDVEALLSGVEKYADLDFGSVYQTNHREKCWTTSKLNQKIPFDKILDDEEMLNDLIDSGPFKTVI